MAYHQEKSTTSGNPEIVIDGWENGIADSPYEGLADIRNANILSSPKQAAVAFATAAVTLPPSGYTATAFTATAATDVITTATTAGFYTGMGITIVSVSGAGAPIVGTTYYVGNLTATSFKLYQGIDLNTVLDVTVDRTGTFKVYTFSQPVDAVSCVDSQNQTVGLANKDTYIQTAFNGYVWRLSYAAHTDTGGTYPANTLQFMGNISASSYSTGDKGIAIFHSYLMVFQNSKIDYLHLTLLTGSNNPSVNWHYAWKSTTTSVQGHRAWSSTDDALYFCNGAQVGSIIEQFQQTFDPANAATYVYNGSALVLPFDELATCLSQLGGSLLVGGIQTYIYPWDKSSYQYDQPLVVAEAYIKCIVSTNSSAYVFAGTRGIIYLTNGSNIQVFKKFPDSISGTIDPYYTWGWAIYLKNQIFFSLSATDNSSTAINNYAGIWALDLDSKALRLSNSLSSASYEGIVPVLVPMGETYPTGDGIYAAWYHAASNGVGFIDYTSGSPYTNFETYIDTDIIPVGTFLTNKTFNNIEFKLAKPLVSGESIRISQRSNLTDSFTLIGTTSTTGSISDYYGVNFENVQWIQLRVEMSSTTTTPSYVLLRELRIR